MQKSIDLGEKKPLEELSKDRSDFVRRLFAVAVSVGFAGHITTFRWIAEFSTPSPESALLFIAMTFVVASWDGYLRSLQSDPLTDFPRFVLDILIVFEYLFLMTLVENIHLFMRVICGIFITYVAWDYAKLLHYKQKYTVRSWLDGLRQMVSRMFTSDKTLMGSSITLWWMFYFLILYWVSETTSLVGFSACCFALFYGAICYRVDKTRRLHLSWRLLFLILPLMINMFLSLRVQACLLPMVGRAT